jgi:hypothetical protein
MSNTQQHKSLMAIMGLLDYLWKMKCVSGDVWCEAHRIKWAHYSIDKKDWVK